MSPTPLNGSNREQHEANEGTIDETTRDEALEAGALGERKKRARVEKGKRRL